MDSVTGDQAFSVQGNKDFFEEYIFATTSLFSNNLIEFRTLDGSNLFEVNELGQPVFVEPELPEEPDGLTIEDGIVPAYDVKLTKSASVKHVNGIPYVELVPYNDDVLAEFVRMYN